MVTRNLNRRSPTDRAIRHSGASQDKLEIGWGFVRSLSRGNPSVHGGRYAPLSPSTARKGTILHSMRELGQGIFRGFFDYDIEH